jgi:hypothetical protein
LCIMPERQGTAAARDLFSTGSDEHWAKALASYSTAIDLIALSKNKPELQTLDLLWRELPIKVNQRSPPHLLLSELSQVMEWKLIRGKFRPLQKMCDSNSPSIVKTLSSSAFQSLKAGDWAQAIKTLSDKQLRGIGPATASAILAPFDPTLCPFMADEVIEVTTGKRDYTPQLYQQMRSSLINKAKELGGNWNAENIGRALWSTATISALGDNRNTGSTSSTGSTNGSSTRINTIPDTPAGPNTHSDSITKKRKIVDAHKCDDAEATTTAVRPAVKEARRRPAL